MPLDTLADPAARRFAELVRERLGSSVLAVRVFGSRARGDFHEESDLDVFVEVEGDANVLLKPIAEAATEVMLELELPFAVTPLVMSREHFAELRRRELRIARDILAEGLPL